MSYILSMDLGTGGMKASLFDAEGNSPASAFESCQTYYPQADFREQSPVEWWEISCRSVRKLLDQAAVKPEEISGIGLSGHSLGVVPVSGSGELLTERVPIWSDSRGSGRAAEWFKNESEPEWYMQTGNGFPAGLYPLFKILWLKEKHPDIYQKTASFLGTKDYLNFRMTGVMATDHSYASGSGCYSLEKSGYMHEYAERAGVDFRKFPEVVSSSNIIGKLTEVAATAMGLCAGIPVACGGVDNSCMAAGAGVLSGGESYLSLGTSAWIAAASDKPVLEDETRPYVFAHLVPGQYVSAYGLFSAGNSFRWVRDRLVEWGREVGDTADQESFYNIMENMASKSSPGSSGLLFLSSLAGGSMLEPSVNIRGAWSGLDLRHSDGDLFRSTLEGILFSLKRVMNALQKHISISGEMTVVGGGGKSEFWMRILASVLEKDVVLSSVNEDAAALGAAACAAVGTGMWKDFSMLKKAAGVSARIEPEKEWIPVYRKLTPLYEKLGRFQVELGDELNTLRQAEVIK